MAKCQVCGAVVAEGRVMCDSCAEKQAKEKPPEKPASGAYYDPASAKRSYVRPIAIAVVLVLVAGVAYALLSSSGTPLAVRLGVKKVVAPASAFIPSDAGLFAYVDLKAVAKRLPNGKELVEAAGKAIRSSADV